MYVTCIVDKLEKTGQNCRFM